MKKSELRQLIREEIKNTQQPEYVVFYNYSYGEGTELGSEYGLNLEDLINFLNECDSNSEIDTNSIVVATVGINDEY